MKRVIRRRRNTQVKLAIQQHLTRPVQGLPQTITRAIAKAA